MNNSMNNTSVDRELSLTLAAGESFSYPGYEYVRVQVITGATEIRVKTNRGDSLHLGLSQSHRFKGEIREFIFENEAASEVTLLLLLANGEFNNPELSGTVTLDVADTLDSLPDDSVATVATELISAANTARKEIIIKNLATNSANFRIGDSGANATNGHELAPGETIIISTTAAVYAYNSHTAAQSLSIVEVQT